MIIICFFRGARGFCIIFCVNFKVVVNGQAGKIFFLIAIHTGRFNAASMLQMKAMMLQQLDSMCILLIDFKKFNMISDIFEVIQVELISAAFYQQTHNF